MLATDLASLILSTLAADAGLSAQELASAIGVSARDLRPALRAVVASAVVVTSGRTRGTRYCLAQGTPSTEAATQPVATQDQDLERALADTAARTAAGQTLAAARRRAAIRAQLERGPALLACEAELAAELQAEQAAASTQVTAPTPAPARKLRYRALRPSLPAAAPLWHRGHCLTRTTSGYLATRGGLVVALAPSALQARQAVDVQVAAARR